MKKWMVMCGMAAALGIAASPVLAQEGGGLGGRIKEWREMRQAKLEAKEQVAASTPAGSVSDVFDGRAVLLYFPETLPAPGKRAMIVVLHGGLGNAGHIEKTLNINGVAEKNGFVVAYLNGAPATKLGNKNFRAWNAGGGCCGQPFEKKIDDVAYIKDAVGYLTHKYGIDKKKIYGMGHSNGAMMTQRLMCETNLYRAAIPVSGPLQLDTKSCKDAGGKKIMAIQGSEDENVPTKGGYGSKGVVNIKFRSEEDTKRIFESSGATYRLVIVDGANHSLAGIDAALKKQTGQSLGEKAATFFNLDKTP